MSFRWLGIILFVLFTGMKICFAWLGNKKRSDISELGKSVREINIKHARENERILAQLSSSKWKHSDEFDRSFDSLLLVNGFFRSLYSHKNHDYMDFPDIRNELNKMIRSDKADLLCDYVFMPKIDKARLVDGRRNIRIDLSLFSPIRNIEMKVMNSRRQIVSEKLPFKYNGVLKDLRVESVNPVTKHTSVYTIND